MMNQSNREKETCPLYAEEGRTVEIEREKPLDGTESGQAVSVSRHSPASPVSLCILLQRQPPLFQLLVAPLSPVQRHQQRQHQPTAALHAQQPPFSTIELKGAFTLGPWFTAQPPMGYIVALAASHRVRRTAGCTTRCSRCNIDQRSFHLRSRHQRAFAASDASRLADARYLADARHAVY